MSIQALNTLLEKRNFKGAQNFALSFFDFDRVSATSLQLVFSNKLYEASLLGDPEGPCEGFLAKAAYALLQSHASLAMHMAVEAKEQFDKKISSIQ